MNFDPIANIIDEPLAVTPSVLSALAEFRKASKLDDLPGTDTTAEKARLTELVHNLTDSLVAGVANHPSKLWVMQQFQAALIRLEDRDTEARDHFGIELERLMDILKIESSNGLLSFYLGGI